jgi:hypothetical protein
MSKRRTRHLSVRLQAVSLVSGLALTASTRAFGQPAPDQRWLLAAALLLGLASWACAPRPGRSRSWSTGPLAEVLLAAALLVAFLLVIDLSNLDERPWDVAAALQANVAPASRGS